ncbi:MAG: OmpH family outer membrane protein [Candidatus Omnitrophica bacterium]|nr:OmpH family outer membrane protein [Candidatus Omnitrophota bacterium]MDD5236425.1 OmpH family outer membrane protein [Candidatus Omnitrophota bacterium]MDD5610102.1 OmpH family outer membrane protein [Candidatus Omnitrophota bacterium]
MKRVLLVLAIALLLALPAKMCMAADKVGHVNLTKLFDEYGKTKEYDAILTGKEKAYESEREKKVNDIKQIQEKYNLLSDKEKAAKKTELENKVKALQEFDNQKQTELLKDRDERVKEILKDIENAVKQYSLSQGYTLILNDRILVYQTADSDITEQVLKILRGGYKGK